MSLPPRGLLLLVGWSCVCLQTPHLVWVSWGDSTSCSVTSLGESEAPHVDGGCTMNSAGAQPSRWGHIDPHHRVSRHPELRLRRAPSNSRTAPPGPLAPRAFPFPQLSFRLFASPTSLSTPFILTFKSFQAYSKAPQTLPLLFSGFWNAENPGTRAARAWYLHRGDGPVPLRRATRTPPPPGPGPSSAASLSSPFVEEDHSCLPHCLVSSSLLGLCS